MAMAAVSPPRVLGIFDVQCSRPHTLRSPRTFTLPPLNNNKKTANVGCARGSKLRSKGVLVLSKAAVGTEDFIMEPTTNVKFLTTLTAPGSSSSLSLVGIAPVEKSLQIVLVCDIDGETFWGALDEAVSPRLKSVGPAEQKAFASFHKTFQGRPLKQGTIICLTWVQPSMMLVSISSDGSPSTVDSAIDSVAVASALFDVYFGSNPVSPSLKKSVASRLAAML